jgi:hypothetical protein
VGYCGLPVVGVERCRLEQYVSVATSDYRKGIGEMFRIRQLFKVAAALNTRRGAEKVNAGLRCYAAVLPGCDSRRLPSKPILDFQFRSTLFQHSREGSRDVAEADETEF